MASRMEIITRTERRRKYNDAEKASILAEADRDGVSVRDVSQRHGISESLIYNWRLARREAERIASEPMQLIAYGAVSEQAGGVVTSVPISAAPIERPLLPTAAEELVRPHPGARPGAIDIDLKSGVRLSVDSYVNEKALSRVLRALRDVR